MGGTGLVGHGRWLRAQARPSARGGRSRGGSTRMAALLAGGVEGSRRGRSPGGGSRRPTWTLGASVMVRGETAFVRYRGRAPLKCWRSRRAVPRRSSSPDLELWRRRWPRRREEGGVAGQALEKNCRGWTSAGHCSRRRAVHARGWICGRRWTRPRRGSARSSQQIADAREAELGGDGWEPPAKHKC
ncbi:skin secretory protein xP2-like [Iris pallida]|uniref:Skin secretory protein xP2-like n=1 Tax=Iris pallida TaxID=29817 RepID=A0AAX6F8L0_IRIPA|nr:skin secretory protein xP2-like [Iris pallida]